MNDAVSVCPLMRLTTLLAFRLTNEPCALTCSTDSAADGAWVICAVVPCNRESTVVLPADRFTGPSTDRLPVLVVDPMRTVCALSCCSSASDNAKWVESEVVPPSAIGRSGREVCSSITPPAPPPLTVTVPSISMASAINITGLAVPNWDIDDVASMVI